MGSWGLGKGVFWGLEIPCSHREETGQAKVGVCVELKARVCVCVCLLSVSSCLCTHVLTCVHPPGCSPSPGPLHSFTLSTSVFIFYVQSSIQRSCCSCLLLSLPCLLPPLLAPGPSSPCPPSLQLFPSVWPKTSSCGAFLLLSPAPAFALLLCSFPSSLPFPPCWLAGS